MIALLIILVMTAGLALRAGTYSRQPSPAESAEETWLVETCARGLILVFISLVGLMALGVMYGNVLGSATASP